WGSWLPPAPLANLIQALRSDGKGWFALTTLLSSGRPCSDSPALENGEASPALEKEEVHASMVSSPFMTCGELFPLSGGFVLSLEEPVPTESDLSDSDYNDDSRAFWVRISSPPLGPVCLRALFILHPEEPTAFEAEASCQVIDLRLELRADVGQGLRLDGLGDPDALRALRVAVRSGRVSAAVRVAEPDFDTEGQPGGSGWIPWAPAKPSTRFL
ncbi:unnamed protein product, partial [Polarella glacialis]